MNGMFWVRCIELRMAEMGSKAEWPVDYASDLEPIEHRHIVRRSSA